MLCFFWCRSDYFSFASLPRIAHFAPGFSSGFLPSTGKIQSRSSSPSSSDFTLTPRPLYSISLNFHFTSPPSG